MATAGKTGVTIVVEPVARAVLSAVIFGSSALILLRALGMLGGHHTRGRETDAAPERRADETGTSNASEPT